MTSSAFEDCFHDMIVSACKADASDIHIEPKADALKIRFRIDGDLVSWKSFPAEFRRGLIFEIKRKTRLSIGVSHRDLDGRVSLPEYGVDLRSSSAPTLFGEKIVLRILSQKKSFRLLDQGFTEKTAGHLKGALEHENGLILISGATGSGKTTTLYSLLREADTEKLNIVTIEDPVEYLLAGITQINVTPKFSFAQVLRAILRQDPDVILVGEVRDAETADLCLKAAATGHLVISTIHANGAIEVIGRLLNLGVDADLVKSCLRFSGAQRLVRRLCPFCSKPSNALGGGQSRVRAQNLEGCSKCLGGTKGRVPVLEYLTSDELVKYFGEGGGLARLTQSFSESYRDHVEAGVVATADSQKMGGQTS
ncbi:ATPase, T2SS/T4P/T4SS family [Bdellovibrionota bacterium FG-2]